MRDEVEHGRSARTFVAAWRRKGKKLARMPAEQTGGDLEVLRGDLVRVLYEATRNETNKSSAIRSPRSRRQRTG